MREKLIDQINTLGLEVVADKFLSPTNGSIKKLKMSGTINNRKIDRMMKEEIELIIIRNCLLGSVRGERTPEKVADKLIEKVKKRPEIEKHINERL